MHPKARISYIYCANNCAISSTMVATAKLYLDPRRKTNDETYPIVLRIIYNKESRTISLNYYVTKEEWNAELEMVRKECKRYSNITRVNNHIHQKQQEAQDALDKLVLSGEIKRLSINEIKDYVVNKKKPTSFGSFTDNLIAELKLAKKYGNASVYEQAKNFIEHYSDGREISFEDITYSFLNSVEAQFLANENSINGLSFYLRTVRAIYNRAIKAGKAKRENYPFSVYSIKGTKTRKRAIRKTDMDKIKNASFQHGSRLWHTRNIFLFSFYNRGMNFADIAKLKLSDIENDRIIYTRSKTSKPFSIKMTDPTREILAHYTPGKSKDDYVFPIFKRDTPKLMMKDLYNERKTFNKYLNRIAANVKVPVHLTSYVARHSWATIAKDLNIPVSVISEGLGHEDIKTTQIYLDEFDTDIIDNANNLIIS